MRNNWKTGTPKQTSRTLGSLWNHFGISLGYFLEHLSYTSGTLSHEPSGVKPGRQTRFSFAKSPNIATCFLLLMRNNWKTGAPKQTSRTLGSLWGHFGITLEYFLAHLSYTSGTLSHGPSGIKPGRQTRFSFAKPPKTQLVLC
jgi:hypothetical protein